MIKFEKEKVVGWEEAIRGMRNPMNSWDKSDSGYHFGLACNIPHFVVGPNDLALMKKIVKAGTDHRKFMRMIVVYVDITAPLYWWKEFDTYKVGTVANSCSTMHKIAEKEFTLDDFSCEHLRSVGTVHMESTISLMNEFREMYLDTKEKTDWWQMIQLLPSSYNQKRTVMLSYEVLANMYKKDSRRNHKLDEWSVGGSGLCNWIHGLPHSELITGE